MVFGSGEAGCVLARNWRVLREMTVAELPSLAEACVNVPRMRLGLALQSNEMKLWNVRVCDEIRSPMVRVEMTAQMKSSERLVMPRSGVSCKAHATGVEPHHVQGLNEHANR